jgi:hypothetical protein
MSVASIFQLPVVELSADKENIVNCFAMKSNEKSHAQETPPLPE